MIQELRVSNFRSLDRDVRVRPARLNFLVGPNGAGKSNLLDVFSFVRDAVTLGLPAAVTRRNGIDSVRRRSHGHPFDVDIGLELQLGRGARASYRFVLTGDRREEYRVKLERAEVRGNADRVFLERSREGARTSIGTLPRVDDQSLALTALGGTRAFAPLVDALSRMAVYAIFPDVLRRPQAFDPSRPMSHHGENWLSILRDLLRHPEDKVTLVSALKRLTGDIEDVRVTRAASHLVAEFKLQARARKGKAWFDAAQQSDGTLRVAGLLTALLQRPRLELIGIEEPELTVHPGALPLLMDHLREASETSQIFVSSHSPELLDLVDLERDAVLVVGQEGGRTRLRPLDEQTLSPLRERLYSLGDLLVAGELQVEMFDAEAR